MPSDLEERIYRIEGNLQLILDNTVELLKRKRAPAQKRQTKAQVHDEAVEQFDAGPTLENSWKRFAAHRREKGAYLTRNAIKAIMEKLARECHSETAKIVALDDSVANGWSGVFPKAQEGGAVMGGDWFSKEGE